MALKDRGCVQEALSTAVAEKERLQKELQVGNCTKKQVSVKESFSITACTVNSSTHLVRTYAVNQLSWKSAFCFTDLCLMFFQQ